MKILLLSDSHGQLVHAEHIIEKETPDRVLHLGDMKADALELQRRYPSLQISYVPGNCNFVTGPECIGITTEQGCRIYYTHGHEHSVKMSLMRLLLAAKEAGAQIAAFGHTHIPYCEYTDGVWLLNPGSCQREGRYALIELTDGVPTCSLHCL